MSARSSTTGQGGTAIGRGPRAASWRPADTFAAEHLARAEDLARLRDELRDWLASQSLGHVRLDDLILAVSEAAANTVEHAYRGGQRGTVVVRGRVEPSGEVVITVRDAGRWRRPDGADGDEGGRGMSLMRALCSEVSLETGRHGTLVTLRQPAANVTR